MARLTTLTGLLRRLRFVVESTTSRASRSPQYTADLYTAVSGIFEYRSVLGRRAIHVRQGRDPDGRWNQTYEWAHVSQRGHPGPYRPL